PNLPGDPPVAVRPPLRTACGSEPGRTCGRCGHQRGPVVTLLAYRFALDPTPAQERALRSHAGAARVAFNWGLARVKAVMDQRAAEATYGIARHDLTPSLSWSLYSLRKDWNAAKNTVAPWWGECSKEAFNT